MRFSILEIVLCLIVDSQSVFSVTIMIQKPEAGGLFRNTRPIRRKGEETADLYQVLEL